MCGHCGNSVDTLTPANLKTFVLNPEPGTWQVHVVSNDAAQFSLGIVVSGSQDLSDVSNQVSVANQAYQQASMPALPIQTRSVSPRDQHHCRWWEHVAIEVACEAPSVFAEDAFIRPLA